ncbi:MAG TPA: acetoacetate decarboxylase family protein [Acidimicrobiales bacterium]|nr:acetoacetate decarboxylase family protein [Acidimicrobiales bacterium]
MVEHRPLPQTNPPAEDDRAGSGPWTVLGRRVAVPVEVRRAAQWSVQYLVPRTAAQRIVSPTGLETTGPVPGRALVALAICRYDDTDLDPYHEVAVSFLVRPHDSPPGASAARRVRELATGSIGVYIHRLPVDQEFSCVAGRGIWGFPKWVASIEIDEPTAGRPGAGTGMSARLVDGDTHVLTLSVAAGGRLRLPSRAPPTYSFADGVLRRTTWTTAAEGAAGRIGGATLTLGDHPMAAELRSLGLPRRAHFSSSTARMRASFDAAEVVGTRHGQTAPHSVPIGTPGRVADLGSPEMAD